MATVLIVEDDESMRMLLTIQLEKRYRVQSAADGMEALKLMEEGAADLIVADIMMPRMNGYELIRELRSMGYTTPVILATAKQEFDDKRDGFAAGADDYMTKPINFDELIWRIDALLRRSKIAADREISIGEFRMDAASYEVFYCGEPIELTKKEFELTYKILSYPNRLFSKDKLMQDIWGYDSPSDDTTVRTHINRLRNKFEGIREFEIVTARGLGYKAVIKEKK